MRIKKHGVVVMTALPPTIGHAALIDFAHEYCLADDAFESLTIIHCTRSDEPGDRGEMFAAINQKVCAGFKKNPQLRFSAAQWDDNYAPQDIETSKLSPDKFWDYWVSCVHCCVFGSSNWYLPPVPTPPGSELVLFASDESYSSEFAKRLGGSLVPYDPGRWIIQTSGSYVRGNVDYSGMMPEYLDRIRLNVVLFGAESVGKTTALGALFFKFQDRAVVTPEWARPYLEAVGSELNLEKMRTIARSQRIIEEIARKHAKAVKAPLVIHDTDLYSTLGYCRLYPQYEELAGELTRHLRSERNRREHERRLYIVLSHENFPFVQDPLRYGGDSRESSTEFWTNLLKEFYEDFVVIDSSPTGPNGRFNDVIDVVSTAMNKAYGISPGFIRQPTNHR